MRILALLALVLFVPHSADAATLAFDAGGGGAEIRGAPPPPGLSRVAGPGRLTTLGSAPRADRPPVASALHGLAPSKAWRTAPPPGQYRRLVRGRLDGWIDDLADVRDRWRKAVRDWVERDRLDKDCDCTTGGVPPSSGAVTGVALPAAAPMLALTLFGLAAFVRRGARKRRVGRRRLAPLHRF